MKKIKETKSWFFENINNFDELLARLIKKKMRIQINKIRNKKGKVTTYTIEILRITKNYYNYIPIK